MFRQHDAESETLFVFMESGSAFISTVVSEEQTGEEECCVPVTFYRF